MIDTLLQIGLAVVMASLGSSCAGTPGTQSRSLSPNDSVRLKLSDTVDPGLQALDPQFYITHQPKRASGAYTMGFAVSAPKGMPNIQSYSVQIYTPDDKLLESLISDEMYRSGTTTIDNGNPSILMYGHIDWTAPDTMPQGSYVRMALLSDKGGIARRVEFPARIEKQKDPIAMFLDVESRGMGVEFTLHVTRNAPRPEGEYLPSSEKFRIEILDQNMEPLWSSSQGMMFSQSLGKVDPAEIGKEITYKARWDGRNYLAHDRAAPGTYRIVATIPAKPSPYIIREEFTWSGK